MVTFRTGLAGSLAGLLVLVAVLEQIQGLGAVAWATALACGAALTVAVARVLPRQGAVRLGPADLVTLSRATLTCGLGAVVAEALLDGPGPAGPAAAMVPLAAAALVLDAVDGAVARRTGTASAFGARFDGEADAFLILVLSVHVAAHLGWWVLAIGAARYLFASAGGAWPWLREQLPPRYWRKVVAAVQGVVLTSAAAEVAPLPVVYAALAAALVLLTESFGRDVLWLWRRRSHAPVVLAVPAGKVGLHRP